MKKKKTKIPKICSTCANCVYIGDGDYICDVDEPIIVMEEHMPNDKFTCCGGADWEPADEDDEDDFDDFF